jgi:hypothetical protein
MSASKSTCTFLFEAVIFCVIFRGMHDPMTVAFEIHWPFRWGPKNHFTGKRDKPLLFRIWHCDPEKDGTDNSCNWFYSKTSKKDKEALSKIRNGGREFASDGKNYMDRVFAPCDYRDVEDVLNVLWSQARQYFAPRPWYRHPRWHVHHWSIQIPIWQTIRRYLFERCSKCGKGYSWNYTPCGNWSGTATWHMDCAHPKVDAAMQCGSTIKE